MMLSGVGTIGVYNYNTRTGILSSKDGEAFTIFHTDENLQYQRKLQKKREERELKERRERKERVEEALEAYAKYRRDLRHYYNELGYQKKMAASSGEGAFLGSVKRPPVVSAAYELILMLGM